MKRKLVAIILAVVLVSANVFVLAACQPAVTDVQFNVDGFKTQYIVGDVVDYSGLSITVKYDNGTSETINYSEFEQKGVSFSGISTDTQGNKNIRIEYLGFSKLIPVVVTAQATVTEIKLVDGSFELTYNVGDTPDYSTIEIEVVYSDGNKTTVTNTEGQITHSAIDTSSAGIKQLTLQYAGKSVTVSVTVKELPKVASITVKEGTFDEEYETAAEINYNAIVLIVKYDNDETKELTVGENLSVITLDKPEITFAGEYTLKITYQGKETSVTFTVNTDTAKVTGVQLSAQGSLTYKQGQAVDYSRFTVVITYENVAEPVTVDATDSRVTFTPIDTKVVGDKDFSVKVGSVDSDPIQLKVIGVSEITVKEDTLKTVYNVGETFQPACTVILHYTDGSTEEVAYNSTGMTYDLPEMNTPGTSTYTLTYTLTVSGQILNTKKVETTITVNALAKVTKFTYSLGYQQYLDGKNTEGVNSFFVTDRPYRVGTDNPFVFIPSATDDKQQNIENIQTVATVYLWNENSYVKLQDEELSAHVSIKDNRYQFTDDAAGNTYKITIALSSIYDSTLLGGSSSFDIEVAVEEGYNVYDALSLSVFDNVHTNAMEPLHAQTMPWDTQSIGDYAATLKAVFIHANIDVARENLPQGYFFNSTDTDFDSVKSSYSNAKYSADDPKTLGDYLEGSLREGKYASDHGNLTQRALYGHTGTVTLYGNYHQITVADDIKVVVDSGMKPTDGSFSTEPHYSLFGFESIQRSQGIVTTDSAIYDLSVLGNAPREEVNGPQGLLLIHSNAKNVTIDNIVSRNFFTNLIADLDGTNPDLVGYNTISNCKWYDSYSNMVFDWQTAGGTITNCIMENAGGPLFVLEDANTNPSAGYVNSKWSVDELTVLTGELSGQETWFVINNAAGYGAELQSLMSLISNKNYTFTVNKGDGIAFNAVAALIPNTAELATNLNPVDVDFTLAGKLFSMTDPTFVSTIKPLVMKAGAPVVNCGNTWMYVSDEGVTTVAGDMSQETSSDLIVYLKIGSEYVGVVFRGFAK